MTFSKKKAGWQMLKLSQIAARFISGGTPSTKITEYWTGNIPWITGADVTGRIIDSGRRCISEEAVANSATNIVPKGAILLVTRTGVGKVAKSGTDIAISQDLTGVVVKQFIDVDFVIRAIESEISKLVSLRRGSTIQGVLRQDVHNIEISLPALPEQRRIADILDKADAIRRKRDESIKCARDLIPSLFWEMFGNGLDAADKGKMVSGWRELTVDQIKASVPYACVGGPFGSNLTRNDYTDHPGVPVIRGTNLVAETGSFIDDGFVYVSERKADSLFQNTARPGDIIFTQRGTLGQVAQIPYDARFCKYIVSQSQMKVTPDERIADPTYVVQYFMTPIALNAIKARTLSTGVPHINLSILKSLPMVLPPLEQQRCFNRLVQHIRKTVVHQEKALAESETLFQALQQKAFRGEL